VRFLYIKIGGNKQLKRGNYMERNIIFYFSGTGNSLKIAKDIAAQIEHCEIVSMGKPFTPADTYERIGFVFPCYVQGMPLVTERFIQSLDLTQNNDAYYFSVVTCGGGPGNCLAQVQALLQEKELILHYGKVVKMFSNYVALYKMADNPKERAEKADEASRKIAADIAAKAASTIPKTNTLIALLYKLVVPSLAKKAQGYRVSDTCVGCKTCANICPVNNITFQETKSNHPGASSRPGLPVFGDHCEQCMACIQWCPHQAINYKNKTQKRGRYHHPDITLDEMRKVKTT
jgi:formate hydrogenlyase subunit 6/NADH:ubiquinone oxidoreductase subunit I